MSAPSRRKRLQVGSRTAPACSQGFLGVPPTLRVLALTSTGSQIVRVKLQAKLVPIGLLFQRRPCSHGSGHFHCVTNAQTSLRGFPWGRVPPPPHFHLALTSTGAPSGSSSKTSSPATRERPLPMVSLRGFLGVGLFPPTFGLCPEFQGCSTAGQAPRPAACPPLDSAGVRTRVQSQSGVSGGTGCSPPLWPLL